jgi:hypothetical protein
VAFGFAIAANVIAAIASALTGKRKQLTAAPESLGDELAAASTSGGFEVLFFGSATESQPVAFLES